MSPDVITLPLRDQSTRPPRFGNWQAELLRVKVPTVLSNINGGLAEDLLVSQKAPAALMSFVQRK